MERVASALARPGRKRWWGIALLIVAGLAVGRYNARFWSRTPPLNTVAEPSEPLPETAVHVADEGFAFEAPPLEPRKNSSVTLPVIPDQHESQEKSRILDNHEATSQENARILDEPQQPLINDANTSAREQPLTDAQASSDAAPVDTKPVAALNDTVVPVVANATRKSLVDVAFMTWCRQVAGIETILEMADFDYVDHAAAAVAATLDDDAWRETAAPLHMQVRGLAASHPISPGQVMIRIPLRALLTVATTIDADVVLGPILGPAARQARGWVTADDVARNDDEEDDQEDPRDKTSYLIELPFLAIALLHHRKLGMASPMYSYLELLRETSLESIPYTWTKTQLVQASPGVRTVAQGIRREIRDRYETIMQVLIQDHPQVFGDAAGRHVETGEYMFSLEMFTWAYTVANSRHWTLPIRDMDSALRREYLNRSAVVNPSHGNETLSFVGDSGVPPAAVPTDRWVAERADHDHVETAAETTDPVDSGSRRASLHSFMAPVADLMNFGPPCARGEYNEALHTFDIVAACAFDTGQEVTFYYSDACEDVMVGAFGFTHPMVPPCPTLSDYQRQTEEWKREAVLARDYLLDAYDEIVELRDEMDQLREALRDCDCDHGLDIPDDDEAELQAAHVRGSQHQAIPVALEAQPPPRQSPRRFRKARPDDAEDL
jgi:hypothetical protein